jgi:hypothetical protein
MNRVRPGEFVNVELTAAMDKEWHIYAFNARYTPTSISITRRFLKVIYEKHLLEKL